MIRDDLERWREAGIELPSDPALGLFGGDCWLRRVSREPVLLFGGGRALLLEVAHPLVAAGVAEHSDFRGDPFGRLQRTLAAVSAIVFGQRAAAGEALRGIERAHERVRGTLAGDAGPYRAGTAYSGRDPELVRWVWATLLDTALVVYQRFVAPLDAEALEAYYLDQRSLARLLGVPPTLLPPDHAGFADWFDEVLRSELSVTAQAREIVDALLAQASGSPVRSLTAALLPPQLRAAFGLPWDERRAERVERLAASVRALRQRPPDAA